MPRMGGDADLETLTCYGTCVCPTGVSLTIYQWSAKLNTINMDLVWHVL